VEQMVAGNPADEDACVNDHKADEVADVAGANLRMCLGHPPGCQHLHHLQYLLYQPLLNLSQVHQVELVVDLLPEKRPTFPRLI
jgi:hypothetical protein